MPGEPETAQKVLLVTPELTSVLECTESSQTFSDKVLTDIVKIAYLQAVFYNRHICSNAHVLAEADLPVYS